MVRPQLQKHQIITILIICFSFFKVMLKNEKYAIKQFNIFVRLYQLQFLMLMTQLLLFYNQRLSDKKIGIPGFYVNFHGTSLSTANFKKQTFINHLDWDCYRYRSKNNKKLS